LLSEVGRSASLNDDTAKTRQKHQARKNRTNATATQHGKFTSSQQDIPVSFWENWITKR